MYPLSMFPGDSAAAVGAAAGGASEGAACPRKKKRCHDRYDSSESSDSGVVVHCGGEDCDSTSGSSSSSSSSSSSDITEPCSPLSSSSSSCGLSSEEMAPTQSSPAWLWGSETSSVAKVAKHQGKITQYFKTKSKGGMEKKTATSVQHLISDLLSDPGDSYPGLAPPTPPATSPESDTSSNRSEIENGDISLLFHPKEDEEKSERAEEQRTIRFPLKTGWSGHFVSDILCKWADCGAKFSTSTALIEHLQIKHVNTQTKDHENYVCKWVNCKVFGRSSCSRTWLERHVLSHGGGKPFRCIVEGCGQRFSNQTILQRHVNSHFSEGKDHGTSRKSCESSNKLIRRNGKKLRIRSHPFSARIYDFFDAGIMEGLQHNLIEMTERRTQGLFDNVPGDTVTVHSKVVGKRVDENGKVQILLRWFPYDIVDDEWVEPSEVERVRHVPIRPLHNSAKESLDSYLFSNQRLRSAGARKRKSSSAAVHIPHNASTASGT